MTAGSRLGPFHLVEPVGEGGQATVWKGRDLRNGNVVAVKILRTALTGPHELERLQREAALLQQLQDPGIPRGLELVRDDAQGLAGLAMEFVEGETLAAASGRTRISTLQALSIGREIARVLSVAHAQGIVHRDVKPANVLLRPGWEAQAHGHVVLVDFGIAKAETGATQYTATGAAIGTVAFMAPELLLLRSGDRAPLAPSLDVYSTGVVVWTMLFGRLPSGLPIEASMSELVLSHARPGPTVAPPDRRAEVESRAPGLVAVLERCVSANVVDRPRDGAALTVALPVPGAGLPAVASAPTSAPTSTPSWTSAVSAGGSYTQFAPSSGLPVGGGAAADPTRVAQTELISPRDRSTSPSGIILFAMIATGVLVIGGVALVGAGVVVRDRAAAAREESVDVSPAGQPRKETYGGDPAPAEADFRTVIYATGELRSAAERSPSNILVKVPRGQKVQLLGQSRTGSDGVWHLVRYGAYEGWMHDAVIR